MKTHLVCGLAADILWPRSQLLGWTTIMYLDPFRSVHFLSKVYSFSSVRELSTSHSYRLHCEIMIHCWFPVQTAQQVLCSSNFVSSQAVSSPDFVSTQHRTRFTVARFAEVAVP